MCVLESGRKTLKAGLISFPASWEANFAKQCTDATHKSATSEGVLRVCKPTSAAEGAVKTANRRGVVWQNEGF